MKRVFAAIIVFTTAGGSTWAADVPRKMPLKAATTPVVAPAPPFTWTGCYLGGQVGGGWGHKVLSNSTGFEFPVFGGPAPLSAGSPSSFDNTASGFLGGGQAGCKLQFGSNWVIGIDGDYSAAELVSSKDLTIEFPHGAVPATHRTKADWLASATANIGYSFDRLLLYAKGGAAWVHDKYGFSGTISGDPFDFEASETRRGWTVGAGIEYAFSKNVSAKIEYDIYNFGNRNVAFASQFPSTVSTGSADIKQYINAIKFGLNYYFWNPIPSSLETSAGAFVPAAAPAATWTQTFSSEVRYFTWQGTRGVPNNVILPNSTPLTSTGSGSELYIPYATQLVGQTENFKFEILGRGGWVRARQSTTGLTGEVATATDTVASGTVTYLGLQGFQPFAALELNLPTGMASLPGTAVHARMDPDLVDIASFGEGFNIGPTLGFNLPLSNAIILTMSAGYTHRGTFDRESTVTPPASGGPSQVPTSISPGNVFAATGSIGYQIGQLNGKLTGTISQETTTTENGTPFVRPGRRYLAAGTLSYAWPQENVGLTTLSASASHSNRNEVLFVPPGAPTLFAMETFNTNSNLYQVGLEHLFAFGQVAFGPTGSFLYRDANGYDPTTVQFVPAKERWAAGMLARYAPNQTVTFNARVTRVWTHENENPAFPSDAKFSVLTGGNQLAFTVPVLSSTGWQFAFGATTIF